VRLGIFDRPANTRIAILGIDAKDGRAHRRVMTHEMIAGTYRQTLLRNESSGYLAKREELRRDYPSAVSLASRSATSG